MPFIVAIFIAAAACGTVGSLASPTAPVDVAEVTPTPSFTDIAKTNIVDLFNRQTTAIRDGDWEAAFHDCSPNYRSRREVERFTEDVREYLSRLDTTPDMLDARNPVATKGRDDRFDLNYDLYIDDEFAESVRAGGAYVKVRNDWYDDGVWCR